MLVDKLLLASILCDMRRHDNYESCIRVSKESSQAVISTCVFGCAQGRKKQLHLHLYSYQLDAIYTYTMKTRQAWSPHKSNRIDGVRQTCSREKVPKRKWVVGLCSFPFQVCIHVPPSHAVVKLHTSPHLHLLAIAGVWSLQHFAPFSYCCLISSFLVSCEKARVWGLLLAQDMSCVLFFLSLH